MALYQANVAFEHSGHHVEVGDVIDSTHYLYTLFPTRFTAAATSVSDTAYDATSWDGVTTIAPSKNAVRDKIEALSAASVLPGLNLAPTAVKTSAYPAAAGDFVPVDTTSGSVTVTLPTAPADKTCIAIKHVVRGSTNIVTYACGGSDVLNVASGATSGTLTVLSQAVVLQYKASTAIWYVVADDMPLSQLDLRFAPAGSAATYAARSNRTSGDLTINGTSWANLDTGLDLVLSAKTGDWVEVCIAAAGGNEAIDGILDVVSLVSGSPVNSWGTDGAINASGYGVTGWWLPKNQYVNSCGSCFHKLVAGDIAAGQVTLRFRCRTVTAGNKTIYASANAPLIVGAINHG